MRAVPVAVALACAFAACAHRPDAPSGTTLLRLRHETGGTQRAKLQLLVELDTASRAAHSGAAWATCSSATPSSTTSCWTNWKPP